MNGTNIQISNIAATRMSDATFAPSFIELFQFREMPAKSLPAQLTVSPFI